MVGAAVVMDSCYVCFLDACQVIKIVLTHSKKEYTVLPGQYTLLNYITLFKSVNSD